jgi:NADPH:quinone reductase
MRAVWYDRQGAADEVLTCVELPTPEAGHGEVRVRLEASGVNPWTPIGGEVRRRWNTRAS